MSLKLSRMSSHRLGSVTINTPRVVLDEIAKCHGISLGMDGEHLVRTINTTPVVGIDSSRIRSSSSILLIKRFVNSQTTWTDLTKLYQAFDFIQSLRDSNTLRILMREVIPSSAVYPTENNVKIISPVILYSMCLLCGITTRENTTAEQMSQYIYNYINNDIERLREQVTTMITRFERSDLINLLNSISPSGVYQSSSENGISTDQSSTTLSTITTSHNNSTFQEMVVSDQSVVNSLAQPSQEELGMIETRSVELYSPISQMGPVNTLVPAVLQNSLPTLSTRSPLTTGLNIFAAVNSIIGTSLNGNFHSHLNIINRSQFLIYKRHDINPVRLNDVIMPTYQQIQQAAIDILACKADIYSLDTPAKYIAYTALVYDYDMRSHLSDLYTFFNQLMIQNGRLESRDDLYFYSSNYIDIVFSPTLPPECYIDDTLEKLLLSEGYSIDTIAPANRYEILVVNSLSNTFHLGKAPNVENENTVINQETVSGLSDRICLSYGVRGQPMQVITMEELLNNFKHYKSLNNPWENTLSLFSNHVIVKLVRLLEEWMSRYNSTTVIETEKATVGEFAIVNSLLHEIKEIIKLDRKIAPATRQLIDIFNNCSDKWKNLINEFFRKLVTVGFYMRGWPGGRSPYPLTRSQSEVNETQAGEIATKSGNAMYQFRQFTDQYSNNDEIVYNDIKVSDLIQLLYSQPLYRVVTEDNGTKIFHRVTSSDEGLTIKDRIEITSQGEVTDNINSCIRLTSNYYLASGYYYMNKLNRSGQADRIYRVQLFDINSLQWTT